MGDGGLLHRPGDRILHRDPVTAENYSRRRRDASGTYDAVSKRRSKAPVNGYIQTKELEDLDSYIVLPSLNDNQGIMGALKLAMDELELAE